MHPNDRNVLERLLEGPIPEAVDRQYRLFRSKLDLVRAGGVLQAETLLCIIAQSGCLKEPSKKKPVLEGVAIGSYLAVRNDFDNSIAYEGELLERGEGVQYGTVRVSHYGDASAASWAQVGRVIVLQATPVWAKPQPLQVPVEGSEKIETPVVDEVVDDAPPPKPQPTDKFKVVRNGTRFHVAEPGAEMWTGPFHGVVDGNRVLIGKQIGTKGKGKSKEPRYQDVPVFISDLAAATDVYDEAPQEELVEA